MDSDRIYDTDIDDRPADMDDLMTFEEWWSEHNANFCCKRPSYDCACGGYTDQLPSGASRLLKKEEDY